MVTEAFFEHPASLQRKHPALYDELRLFYRQDPLAFAQPNGQTPSRPARSDGSHESS